MSVPDARLGHISPATKTTSPPPTQKPDIRPHRRKPPASTSCSAPPTTPPATLSPAGPRKSSPGAADISAEHGIGKIKRDLFRQMAAMHLARMRALKKSSTPTPSSTPATSLNHRRPPPAMTTNQSRLERWEARLKKYSMKLTSNSKTSTATAPAATPTVRPRPHLQPRRRRPLRHWRRLHRRHRLAIRPGCVVRPASPPSTPSPRIREKFEAEVIRRLREKLPAAFPDTILHVDRDGPVYKIHGDLSLGQLNPLFHAMEK